MTRDEILEIQNEGIITDPDIIEELCHLALSHLAMNEWLERKRFELITSDF